jgi:hypothetical protein
MSMVSKSQRDPCEVLAHIGAFGLHPGHQSHGSPQLWAMFDLWMDENERLSVMAQLGRIEDAELRRKYQRLVCLEKAILDQTTTCAADILIKIMTYTAFGGSEVSDKFITDIKDFLGLSSDPRART